MRVFAQQQRGDYRARYWDIPSFGTAGSPPLAPPPADRAAPPALPPAAPAPVLLAPVLPAAALLAAVLPAPVLPAPAPPALPSAPPPAPWANAKVEPRAKNIANAMTGNFFMIELSVLEINQIEVRVIVPIIQTNLPPPAAGDADWCRHGIQGTIDREGVPAGPRGRAWPGYLGARKSMVTVAGLRCVLSRYCLIAAKFRIARDAAIGQSTKSLRDNPLRRAA